MGMGAWWHWLVVLAIVVLIFGTKKLRNIGEDLGGAVKGFKEGMKSGEEPPRQVEDKQAGTTIEGEVKDKTQTKA